MNSNNPYDPYAHNGTDPVEFTGDLNNEKEVVIYVGDDVDGLTNEHVATAIAGILQLTDHPSGDLRRYVDYLPEVEAFLASRSTPVVAGAPLPAGGYARAGLPRRRDPLAGL